MTDPFVCPQCGADLYATGGTFGGSTNVTTFECALCRYKGLKVSRPEPGPLHVYDEDAARYDAPEGCVGVIALGVWALVIWLLVHFGVI